MDFSPTPEQEEIISSVSALLLSELPKARLRELLAKGASVDDGLWYQCASLGWFGLGLDEFAGGVGYGLTEETLLFREIGRHLAPGPFLPTVLAVRVASGTLRAALLEGSARAALVVMQQGSVSPDRITGTALVYDHLASELGVVVEPDGASLIDLSAVGERMSSSPGIDPLSPAAIAHIDHLRPLASVAAAHDPVFARGAVLVAAMASGIAEATRDLAADHARSREQFGRPIGVNQAIKHACTDMAVRAEAATTQTLFAAMTLDNDRPDLTFQASAAKVVATDAGLENARTTVQVHGGLGFTWEHDAHLHLKRSHVLDQIIGSRRHHLATLIDLPPAQ